MPTGAMWRSQTMPRTLADAASVSREGQQFMAFSQATLKSCLKQQTGWYSTQITLPLYSALHSLLQRDLLERRSFVIGLIERPNGYELLTSPGGITGMDRVKSEVRNHRHHPFGMHRE